LCVDFLFIFKSDEFKKEVENAWKTVSEKLKPLLEELEGSEDEENEERSSPSGLVGEDDTLETYAKPNVKSFLFFVVCTLISCILRVGQSINPRLKFTLKVFNNILNNLKSSKSGVYKQVHCRHTTKFSAHAYDFTVFSLHLQLKNCKP